MGTYAGEGGSPCFGGGEPRVGTFHFGRVN
jgi:hypothetical protein